MNSSKFSGMGTAIVTPFRKDGSIDFKSLGKLVEYQITNNANYLVVLGSTGEAATISKDEKIAIINHVCDINAKRVPIVVGFGGNNKLQWA